MARVAENSLSGALAAFGPGGCRVSAESARIAASTAAADKIPPTPGLLGESKHPPERAMLGLAETPSQCANPAAFRRLVSQVRCASAAGHAGEVTHR